MTQGFFFNKVEKKSLSIHFFKGKLKVGAQFRKERKEWILCIKGPATGKIILYCIILYYVGVEVEGNVIALEVEEREWGGGKALA